MKALMLTAGLATRFRPHTSKVPKPLLPFCGIPLFLYGYELLKSMGVNEFIFNRHHLPEQLRQGVMKYAEQDIDIHFSDEIDAILGSAGAIKQAASFLDVNEDFILCNGDEVFFTHNSLSQAIQEHQQEHRLATLIVTKHPEAGKKFGAVWINEKEEVVGFGKEPIANASPTHYIGIMLLNARILSRIPLKETNILYDTLLPLLKSETVKVHKIDCEWFETGNEKDYIEAHQEIITRFKHFAHYPQIQNMFKKYLNLNINLTSPHLPLIYKQGNVAIANDAILEGFIWLQDGASIGSKAHVKNSVIGTSAVVAPEENVTQRLILA